MNSYHERDTLLIVNVIYCFRYKHTGLIDWHLLDNKLYCNFIIFVIVGNRCIIEIKLIPCFFLFNINVPYYIIIIIKM